MKKLLVINIIFVMLSFMACKSNSNNQETNYKHYSGNIGEMSIKMSLNRDSSRVWGYYYSLKTEKEISVSGTIDENNNIILKAHIDSETTTGTFTGTLKKNTITGIWEDNNSEREFSLKEDYSKSIKFESYSRKEKHNLLNIDSFPVFNIAINSLYPVNTKNGKVLTELNNLIYKSFINNELTLKETPTETYDNYIETMIADYDNIVGKDVNPEEIYEDSWMYQWEYDANCRVMLNDNNIVCLSLSYYEYGGGAHGNYASDYLNYDIKNKSEITLNQVIDTVANSDALTKLILKELKEQGRIEDLFSKEEVYATENFYLDFSGIGFVYNPYEIGPYVAGAFDVYFVYEDIKHLLRKDFKKKLGIKN